MSLLGLGQELNIAERKVLHMPCIIIRTNVEIPSDRAKELKTALAVSWEKVPTKRERWLMIVMETSSRCSSAAGIPPRPL